MIYTPAGGRGPLFIPDRENFIPALFGISGVVGRWPAFVPYSFWDRQRLTNHRGRGKNMRLSTSFLLLSTFLALPGSFVYAQSTEAGDKAAASASGSAT